MPGDAVGVSEPSVRRAAVGLAASRGAGDELSQGGGGGGSKSPEDFVLSKTIFVAPAVIAQSVSLPHPVKHRRQTGMLAHTRRVFVFMLSLDKEAGCHARAITASEGRVEAGLATVFPERQRPTKIAIAPATAGARGASGVDRTQAA